MPVADLTQVGAGGADRTFVTSAGAGTREPTWGGRALRLAVGTTLFVLAGYLGRATVIGGQGISLIWPAIGIAGLWIASGNRRTWPADLLALSISIVVVTTTTGATLPRAGIFLATNLTQVLVFVALTRLWTPHLWGLGGTEQLHRLVDLGRLTLAAGLSGVAGLTTAFVGSAALLGVTLDPLTLAVWWGRNTVALIVITVLSILAGRPLARAGGPAAAARSVREALRPSSRRRLLEAVALLALTVVLSFLIFSDPTGRPLSFLLLVMSVWAGLRFGPVVVTVHGVVMGICGIAFTLAGDGPFAAVGSIHYRALVAQAFVAMTVLTGLALAFSRAERDAANVELAAARRAADERAQLLDAVLESMQEGVVVVEDGGRLLLHNSASRELAGLLDEVPDHVRGASEYGLFHSNGLPLKDEEMANARALAGETVAPFDVHVRAASIPEGRVLEISGQPLLSDDPAVPRRAMVNLRDVTLERQHRDTLASFAGVVAHDLFNPLSVLGGWTEALADEFSRGPVSPVVGEVMVTRIDRAATHMRDFIADLMSYTIARDQSLRYGPVDVTATVRALAAMRSDGPSAPLIAVADGLRVWADAGLVRQLLDNLIGNALKYVGPGVRPVVEVSGEVIGDWLELRVVDNGIGIPEHQREEVFETFHRAHGDGFHGTGLGLAICRRIVDRHGGTIHVVGAPRGTGSTFVFRLPRLAVLAGAPAVPSQEQKV
ncbi:ATP-binding protein [Nocardioides marmoriginsengisoli]|nr:ATP-binding protein [Nocardioides marmoriginsengisoli]